MGRRRAGQSRAARFAGAPNPSSQKGAQVEAELSANGRQVVQPPVVEVAVRSVEIHGQPRSSGFDRFAAAPPR